MTTGLDELTELYSDNKTCARLVGLNYVEGETDGITRVKCGKGFAYHDARQRLVANKILKQRIAELVVPPAWQEVWICPSGNGHVLATGIDEKGRKQYIYHPKWRTMRDLIKFYRLIIFARSLPKIRREIDRHLAGKNMTREKVLATMLWILDNAYIRVGNDTYFQENESVGLTTLTDKNIIIAGSVVTLSFKGKSGKDQQITFDNTEVAKTLNELSKVRGARLFRYADEDGVWHDIPADEVNSYLHSLTNVPISAKDFRTWGGTLMAFLHLIEADETSRKKPEKIVVEAIDQAAAVLGNTRAVARSSYVHPHILGTYAAKDFAKYYARAQESRKLPGLDRRESELLRFLELLFDEQFSLLRQGSAT